MTDDISDSMGPLLEYKKGLQNGNEHQALATRRRVTIGLFSIVLMVTACFAAVVYTHVSGADTLIYSPANSALRTEISDAWDPSTKSPWLYGSRSEIDKAWARLMEGSIIRMTEEDIDKTQANFSKLKDTIVYLNDGEYVGHLGVYHHLHCIKLLMVRLHQEEYKLSPDDYDALNIPHFDHCLDALRSQIMCQPDLTFYPLTWTNKSDHVLNKAARTSSKKSCANWQLIEAWATERRVDVDARSVRPNPFDRK